MESRIWFILAYASVDSQVLQRTVTELMERARVSFTQASSRVIAPRHPNGPAKYNARL